MIKDRVVTEPSPAHTPLESPPGVQPSGTIAAPPPIPDETAPLPNKPFADELPPDFWGDELVIPEATQTTLDRYADAADSFSQPEIGQARNVKPLTGPLESDPRFVLLTELFPGRVTDWQSAETLTAPVSDDADEASETVDLEAGLDADEPD